MPGRITIVGLGPGGLAGLTQEASQALEAASGVFLRTGGDPPAGLQVADGADVGRRHFPPLSPDRPALLGQVYSRLVASDLKLTLLAQYPPQHVVLVLAPTVTPEGRVSSVPLAELAREERFSTATAVYVPAVPVASAFESLQEIIAHLRAPDGCPWDRQQSHASLRPHLLEEAHQTLGAVAL